MEALSLVVRQNMLAIQWAKKMDLALSVHGLHFSEFLLLHHLYQMPQQILSRVALADKVGLSASGVTRMLQPMEKIGLVEKSTNPRDARQSLVGLSDAGRQIYRDALQTAEQMAEQMLGSMGEDGRQAMDTWLSRLQA